MSDNVSDNGNQGSGASRPKSGNRVYRALLAVLTFVVLALVVVALLFAPWPGWLVDQPGGNGSGGSRQVHQTQLTYYCPSKMALSDTGKYGDSQFQANDGDMASSARYGAFGSVYRATVGPLTNGSEASDEILKGPNSIDGASVKTLGGSLDQGSRAFDTHLLAAKSGTGATASIASWATTGDLQGVAATACQVPALRQDFLLTGTKTGSTQQLVVANPSSKATSLQVKVWDTKHNQQLQLSTGSTLNVGANGESTMELSSAVPGADGLFVSIDSGETPVSAVVRSVSMDGLDAKGSDFVTPVGEPSNDVYLPGINEGDQVRLLLHAETASDATISWVNSKGSADQAKQQHVEAGKVAVVDLGAAPQDIAGIRVSGSAKLNAEANVTQSSDGGHVDFAFVSPVKPAAHSAIALPDKTSGELTLLNDSDEAATTTIRAYDGEGSEAGSKQISVPARGGIRVAVGDVSDKAALITLDHAQHIAWGMRVTQSDVSGAGLAGVAYISPSSLEPQSAQVWAKADRSIVR
ncbi:DUF5719 family protein [Bifidobacterium sp. ESL0790]|uniref:DUF5719 family protein n=1 Tax=Bifidobacterium sp. ESL0790 TaxID=2983233 RepID=UPI0023FA14F2|nr:DUF5719 family protein [Bifidobacterium sp. ESL0790]WEV73026.1 DUF5719 family protein [Bifidobacterium sp. ESL0790]